MRVELELSQDEWDALHRDDRLGVIDPLEGVSVRLRDSLLVEERECLHVEFCANAIVKAKGRPDRGVHVQVWLGPEKEDQHVGNSNQ